MIIYWRTSKAHVTCLIVSVMASTRSIFFLTLRADAVLLALAENDKFRSNLLPLTFYLKHFVVFNMNRQL